MASVEIMIGNAPMRCHCRDEVLSPATHAKLKAAFDAMAAEGRRHLESRAKPEGARRARCTAKAKD